MNPEQPPRSPEEVVRMVDADLAAREARDLIYLRSAMQVGAVEIFLLASVFSFSIGLIVTAIFALPQDNEKIYYFMVLWTVGFIGSMVLSVEFLVRKFRAVRRLLEIMERRLTRLEKK